MKTTVTPDWVKKHSGSPRLTIVDARSRSSFVQSHIPGSINADFFHYLVPGTDAKGLAQFHKDLANMLGKIGLRAEGNVVVYESGFGMRAARTAWMLQYAGLKNVSMLEDGFRAWRHARYPVKSGPISTIQRTFHLKPDASLLSTSDRIARQQSSNRLVLDVRSKGEYEGSDKRDCCARYGRIPGAVWLEWTQFLRDGQSFLNNRSFRKSLKQLGIVPEREIITYCHRGARAASAFYALKSMGFHKVRNYVGSWHEWSAKAELPAEIDAAIR